ncbi:MAG: serine-type D-Ala-D-Ala carboxypeptidase, D-alanyl-D-alanine carboxypeptidase (penicillin-binding protein 5/6) [Candidatus Gottesmanbacteria bacterium GW2011_GWA2_43_14]|uniref:Serine-type D-Ala-D-Ala carboxypeptidase, D-alanyl-D-alanine carboxypeptidase (Penicillin-binding protein 5/6) n=1 Tax=Candidatus Gottesmanbacteria bacterium GW2011_GWA2_43_14 TaxID=1618443 RepID=A0A0G1DKI3_9BACT|nr:MAG: serine-type D-Ala-D-Ala carboxypeptidase, D-alanyl-D-alanine carboxypeptidase (penicillin-binding protein 5/6) [Candidatus Gottesmanbacteria bacterium GW2011_GWA2_43_14]
MKDFEVKFDLTYDKQKFRTLNWKIFLVSMAVSALLSVFTSSIPRISLLSPAIDNMRIDVFSVVLPKLKEIPNEFILRKKSSLVSSAYATGELDKAKAYGIINFETGEIIREKNLDKILPIASLTKVMTAVVAMDLADKDETFTVSRNAANKIPTKIGVVPGQKLSLEELLNALLLTSANDAAEVIKEGIDSKYGAEIFIRAMNAKAEFLGLRHSTFQNPQGFDAPNHYSSAGDMTVLSHYALENYPVISQIVVKDFQRLSQTRQHKKYDLYNWNGLIGVYPNVFGVKIGYTGKAGKTTVVVSQRDGVKIMAVVLGAPTVLARDLWAGQALDIGFEETAGLPAINISEQQLKAKYLTWNNWP